MSKFFVGGFIGLSFEIIYLLSIIKTYPYKYFFVLFALSFIEGGLILYLLDKLKLLPTGRTYGVYLFTGITYLILRIITRTVGTITGTGLSLLVENSTNNVIVLKAVFVLAAFLINTILLLIVLSFICYIAKTLKLGY